MAIFGVTQLGTDTLGFSLPPTYVSPGFTANSLNYGTIQVTWSAQSATVYRYRLLTSRYGYPVNENDGTIVIDSVAYPGGSYTDTQVIPGSYHYYGLYVLSDVSANTWIRSGVAGCLAPYNFGSSQWLLDKLPEHFKYLPQNGGALTGDATGNSYLQQFLSILGWGFDYVQTQYAMLAQHLNDPYQIPLDDLLSMAAEVGLDYSPGTPAYTIRKGVANQAHVARQRGTLLGLENEVIIRTGWGADVQVGPNLMLATDESAFLSPMFDPWTASKHYAVGECVWTGPALTSRVWSGAGYWYQCLTANQDEPPPGDGTSSTYWQCLSAVSNAFQTLTNPLTSLPVTWEALNAANSNGYVPPGTLGQALGVASLTGAGHAWNSLVLKNTTGSAQTLLLRSVARSTASLNLIPDGGFESGFTTIVPGSRPDPTWVPKTWPQIYKFVPPTVSTPFYYGQKGQRQGYYLATAFWIGQNCWITRTGTAPHSGSWSGLITPQGLTGPAIQAGSPWFAVAPGNTISLTAYLRMAPGASNITAQSQVTWFDTHGAPLSSTTPVPTSLTSTYAEATLTGTAPSGTVYGCLTVTLPSTQAVLIDDVSLIVTASGYDDTYSPDQTDVIGNAIPVPWVGNFDVWDASTRYATGSLAQYRGLPFKALRASTGAVPPINCVATPEWAPLSENSRVRVAVSAYLAGSSAVPVTPFAEWYDQHGNFITRVFAQTNADNGAVAKPANLIYDSFVDMSRLTTSGGSGTVVLPPWQASFWANGSLSGVPAYTRTDSTVNFTWNGVQPAPSIGNSGWSARWVTSFTPAVSGTYSFTLNALSGSRLIVNGSTVLSNWTAPSDQTASVALPAGTPAVIEVNYMVPSEPPGSWTGNLIPVSWTPTSPNASWTSPLFPVIGSFDYKLSASLNVMSGTFYAVTAQVIWYDASGARIGTAQATTTAPPAHAGYIPVTVLVGGDTVAAPPEAVNAQVYVSIFGSGHNFSMSFTQRLSAIFNAGVTLASPVPFTASGPQYSSLLAGRLDDTSQATWQANVGSFNVLAGKAWPVTPGTRSYSLINGQANTMLGVTLATLPSGSLAQGLIFRYSSDTSYWRCDQTGIRYKNGSTWVTGATHSTAFSAGDRMTLELNGSVITCYRNNVQVSTVTSSYNSSMSEHGILSYDAAVA